VSLKHVINLIIQIRDTGCHKIKLEWGRAWAHLDMESGSEGGTLHPNHRGSDPLHTSQAGSMFCKALGEAGAWALKTI
jgi:hypothetical protein